jgi:hypothetical protein
MTLLKIAAMAGAAAAFVGISACNTVRSDNPNTGAQAEVSNAGNLGANGSAQPGGAGPSPNGGNSNPGTSGSISPTPGPTPH